MCNCDSLYEVPVERDHDERNLGLNTRWSNIYKL